MLNKIIYSITHNIESHITFHVTRFYVTYKGDYYPNPLGSLPNMFEDNDA